MLPVRRAAAELRELRSGSVMLPECSAPELEELRSGSQLLMLPVCSAAELQELRSGSVLLPVFCGGAAGTAFWASAAACVFCGGAEGTAFWVTAADAACVFCAGADGTAFWASDAACVFCGGAAGTAFWASDAACVFCGGAEGTAFWVTAADAACVFCAGADGTVFWVCRFCVGAAVVDASLASRSDSGFRSSNSKAEHMISKLPSLPASLDVSTVWQSCCSVSCCGAVAEASCVLVLGAGCAVSAFSRH